jgi:hypothetical protein
MAQIKDFTALRSVLREFSQSPSKLAEHVMLLRHNLTLLVAELEYVRNELDQYRPTEDDLKDAPSDTSSGTKADSPGS